MRLFHVGYVVDDIRQAMAEYGDATGLTWAQPTLRPVRVLVDEDTEPVEVQLWATYSQQGPPHLELIQEVRGGVWGGVNGSLRLDHVGYWESDLRAGTARLMSIPGTAAVRAVDEQGRPSRFAYFRPPSGGPWLELVEERVRPELSAWIQGEPYRVS